MEKYENNVNALLAAIAGEAAVPEGPLTDQKEDLLREVANQQHGQVKKPLFMHDITACGAQSGVYYMFSLIIVNDKNTPLSSAEVITHLKSGDFINFDYCGQVRSTKAGARTVNAVAHAIQWSSTDEAFLAWGMTLAGAVLSFHAGSGYLLETDISTLQKVNDNITQIK